MKSFEKSKLFLTLCYYHLTCPLIIISGMYNSLAEIRENFKQISARRRECDDALSDVQGLLKGKSSRLPVARVRVEFQRKIETLKEAAKSNLEQLEQLRYRAERLKMEGTKFMK